MGLTVCEVVSRGELVVWTSVLGWLVDLVDTVGCSVVSLGSVVPVGSVVSIVELVVSDNWVVVSGGGSVEVIVVVDVVTGSVVLGASVVAAKIMMNYANF